MRSIFSRYMITFSVLIILAFASMTVIISILLNNNGNNMLADSMNRLSVEVAAFIDEMHDPETQSFEDTINVCIRYKRLAHLSSAMSLTTVITDNNGKLLACYDEYGNAAKKSIVSGTVREIADTPNELLTVHFFEHEDKCFCIYVPYFYASDKTETPVKLGNIFILSNNSIVKKTVYSVAISCIVCSIWVLSAAVIALYFIGERLNQPMKDIRECLGRFESGDFSVRMNEYNTAEFNEISTSFNRMASAIESVEHSRRMFISDISHDLRTPMTKIKGFVDAILDGTVPPEKQDYYLGIVSAEITRLSRLVSTLLDISRMESGKQAINPEVFDVCEIIRLIVISFEDKINQKKINFELETDEYNAYVYADHDAIYQVLYNLIDNAVKFTEDAGTLKVIVKRTSRSAKYAITVFNTGIGIREEELSCVFDRFFKADVSRGYDKTGVGLGLFIVKTKLDLHGEHIKVESEYGKNCSFTFELKAGEKPKKKPGTANE